MSSTIWLNPKHPPNFDDFLFTYVLGWGVLSFIIGLAICFIARPFITDFNESAVLMATGFYGAVVGIPYTYWRYNFMKEQWYRHYKIVRK